VVSSPEREVAIRKYHALRYARFMQTLIRVPTCCLLTAALFASYAPGGLAQTNSREERTGQHDFDFEIGSWKTDLKVLSHPPTGSATWIRFSGTSVVRKIWNGRANVVELEADGPSAHIEALSLRLYNPESHQWSLNFANSKSGSMSIPTIGEFKNGRGEFYDMEAIDGRNVLVRGIWSDITQNSCHFEQSVSADGGKTWETNWIATDTRIEEGGRAGNDPNNPLSASLKTMYEVSKSYVLKTAEKMPADNYSFQPVSTVRTFGQLVAHVADAQYSFCSTVMGDGKKAPLIENNKTDKADIVLALHDAFAYCDSAYHNMTDAQAADMVTFFFRRTFPKLSVLTFNNAHNFEHFENMATYLRIKGLTPPTIPEALW
jgi:uncharacterized damage-inducible protein DinB